MREIGKILTSSDQLDQQIQDQIWLWWLLVSNWSLILYVHPGEVSKNIQLLIEEWGSHISQKNQQHIKPKIKPRIHKSCSTYHIYEMEEHPIYEFYVLFIILCWEAA